MILPSGLPLTSSRYSYEPLPSDHIPSDHSFPDAASQSAFESCLWLEELSSWETFTGTDSNLQHKTLMLQTPPQVAARTLGYALLFAPTELECLCVAREINACDRDAETLAGLARLYIYGVIRMFHNPKGAMPLASPACNPRRSFEDLFSQNLVPAGATPEILEEKIMARDRRRCVFTATGDMQSLIDQHPDVMDLWEERTRSRDVEVAYIISQSLTARIGGLTDGARGKLAWASSASTILDRFAGIDVREILGELGVHSPVNAMLASHDAHARFADATFSLEQAPDDAGKNVYTIHDLSPWRTADLLPQATFVSVVYKDEVVEPPSPALLALHAACARVACMSGAADALKEFDKEVEPHRVLSMGLRDMAYNARAAREMDRALYKASMMPRVGIC
ncbi:hypothetical protein DFH06DRAFT_469170 [Mycena polygramma]|nr:hypothetical protein DFH06DRAFT_469170 [Mycena polygramma]